MEEEKKDISKIKPLILDLGEGEGKWVVCERKMCSL